MKNMLLPDEKTFISGLQKGNIVVFERIFSLYHKRIYNFCIRLHQSSDDAEETVQRVFVALWEQRAQVDENKSFDSYLFTIARYMVYQDFRQRAFKKAVYDNLTLYKIDLNESTMEDVLYEELFAFLESVIERLPERQQKVFKLSRFSGLTYRQIGEQLNISENTVDTQMRRALSFIRDKYETFYTLSGLSC
jgi:RNA polymerase sigma-70 factor (family 1)